MRIKKTIKKTIVSGFFLGYIVINIRCVFISILNQRCSDNTYNIPVLILNSAVNPLAYAPFKRDIKKELKRLMCTVTLKLQHRRKTHSTGQIVKLVLKPTFKKQSNHLIDDICSAAEVFASLRGR